MSNLKDYDFIVGFTLFTPKGFKTMYRHFDKKVGENNATTEQMH